MSRNRAGLQEICLEEGRNLAPLLEILSWCGLSLASQEFAWDSSFRPRGKFPSALFGAGLGVVSDQMRTYTGTHVWMGDDIIGNQPPCIETLDGP